MFQRAIRQFLFQAQEVVAGLGHINVDRIKLLHGCQRSRLTVLYQCAFRHVRLTNATANRRGDFGVSQIDSRSFNGSFRRSYRSIRLLRISQSLIVLLLTDVLSTEQFLITIHRQLRDIGCSLGFRQITFRTVVCRLIGRRINLIERDTCFDVATFFEITLQDNPANLRTNFCDPVGTGATRKLGCDLQRFSFDCYYANGGHLLATLLGLFVVTSC